MSNWFELSELIGRLSVDVKCWPDPRCDEAYDVDESEPRGIKGCDNDCDKLGGEIESAWGCDGWPRIVFEGS